MFILLISDMPTKLKFSKAQKSFFAILPGKLKRIISKSFLIDSTVKNTSEKEYLESLAYRADNARQINITRSDLSRRICLSAVYISAKSKFLSTPKFARIAVTSFKLHESR